ALADIKDEKVKEMEYRLEKLFFSTAPDPWKQTELTGEYFKHADVAFTQTYSPYVAIEFTTEGGKLFEQLTERNVNKRLAIFVGGQLISAPNVNEKISGGRAQITGNFSVEDATNLARDLNTGAIPAPIVLVGQYTIGASLGHDALNSSVKAGIVGLIILALFMIVYYRFLGFLANIALLIYALALIFFIKIALPLWLALIIGLVIFGFLVSAILRSKDSGWEKFISFAVACFVLFFITFVLATPIVLTLAGVAGVVLSIGMAVDANILIFERIREELRNKRPLSGAIEIGFERAWSSIRDSNFSSLITTAILIYFGFTAITITRTFLRLMVGTSLANNQFLLGVPKTPHPALRIVQNRKIWFGFSGILIIIALIALPLNGLKFGLDFTGGTLMEIQFNQPVETKDVTDTLKEVENKLLTSQVTQQQPLDISPEDETILINFGEPIVVSSGENSVIVRLKHISNETHDAISAAFTEKFGTFEETRYTTIGPTIGQTMKTKAVIALGMALLMMVVYIAFAFRKVPRELNPWRFGLTAIAALAHDLTITVGVFVILGKVFGVEIDALFITALLTILGFSVHDTIVVFDRIRENLKLQQKGETFEEVANRAVNETLARSINTSASTLFTILALFALGAGSIHYFLLALIVGLVSGTYSSIFTATPLLVAWDKWKPKKGN
ncbi:MAG: protein-export membrane protein SecD, SecD/SecF fusion protein, partial [Candidatus Peregrinibacteria bacterium GW2011_GWE2_39_6]